MIENKMQSIGNLKENNQKGIISDKYKFYFSFNVEVDNVGEYENCGPPSTKEPCIVLTSKLHVRFVKVVNQIGLVSMIFQPLIYFSLFM